MVITTPSRSPVFLRNPRSSRAARDDGLVPPATGFGGEFHTRGTHSSFFYPEKAAFREKHLHQRERMVGPLLQKQKKKPPVKIFQEGEVTGGFGGLVVGATFALLFMQVPCQVSSSPGLPRAGDFSARAGNARRKTCVVTVHPLLRLAYTIDTGGTAPLPTHPR